jgi:ERCC4-type nuclease
MSLLIIDSREPPEIKTALQNKNTKCEQLHVGDYLFQDEEGNVQLIIERKSICDLQSSLKDGRFREQRSRLLELNCKIIYIIEGKLINDNYISGVLENMALYHNICIIPTVNIQHTIHVLQSLYKKVGEKYIPPYVSLFKGRKRQDHNKKPIEMMLETIPGISPIVSKAICDVYPTPAILVKNLQENPNVLYGLEITPKRKLGPKLADKIYTNFLQ